MTERNIVTMPGDGIGKIVLQEAVRVLDAVGFKANYIYADIGWEFWCKEGNPLPQRTVDLLEEHRIGFFGAITSKPKDEAAEELTPELQGKGYVYYSPIVGLRQHFNLDLCIRPCRSFKGNPLNYVRRINGDIIEPDINVVIFRQNTEGLYAGVEWTNPPDEVRSALETHPKMSKFKSTPSEDIAISTRIFTRKACHRIVLEAFKYAHKYGYRSVTICEKPNVIRETSGMLRNEALKIAPDYPEIQLWHTNIDAQMMWLNKNPEDYGIIVSGNMFGDIVSDAFAGLVGGLGFANSANIGETCAIFEPTHGSAPKYEELDPPIVNPIAMVLSACLMLEHLGEEEYASRIRNAIGAVIAEGKVRTYDMLRLVGGPDVIAQGAASTQQMTDAIIERL
ncbi:MAG: isocitrate/isopropylmalate dehydrogenase family protein [Candidatus Aminicenantes bacterium]|nr:MAG: isocitrate/isopropylmalate dehydrogenase family protein [Candidatus Aminicenantes bacterium]